jgi:Fur family transcriptional regulator, ferric uptake regulator
MAERPDKQTPASDAAHDWRAAVISTLAAAGFRSTLPRREIIGWIAETREPFRVETLVTEMEAQRGLSSRATVYRLVDWLRLNGWLTRVYSDSINQRYARRRPGHVHQAVCTQCGDVIPIESCNLESLVDTELATHGFTVQGHVLEIFGTCAGCETASVKPAQ